VLERVELLPRPLTEYEGIVGEEVIDELRDLAAHLEGIRVLHVNATAFGGGVAEILPTLGGLMLDAGIDAHWGVMQADEAFFESTKRLHNALQGQPGIFGPEDQQRILETAGRLSVDWPDDADIVIIHDPQPLAIRSLIPQAPGRWIWRCHIDTSEADHLAWSFVRPLIHPYDAAIFTLRSYAKPDLDGADIAVVPPAIDPLAPKNAPLADVTVRAVLIHYGIDPDRPLLLQVSRFDPWKDPVGVIEVFRRVRKRHPELQLALVGSMATDDPEGWRIQGEVRAAEQADPDIFVLSNLDGVGALEVNAFQRGATVVLQKSLREGFGLTVSEAMWKGTPVVATRVGGIPIQLGDDEGGRLVDDIDGAVEACDELIRDADLRAELGRAGRERVRRHFLSTRNARDYFSLMRAVLEDRPDLIPGGVEGQDDAPVRGSAMADAPPSGSG
jgi:trehalose synthase